MPSARSVETESGISIAIETIHFCDSSTEALGRTDIVVIVGANNSGKTRFLKDLWEAVAGEPGRARSHAWADEVTFIPKGEDEEFLKWFHERARYQASPNGDPEYAISHRSGPSSGIHLERHHALNAWKTLHQFPTIARYMVTYLSAADRGQIKLSGRPARNPAESPYDALHHLWDSRPAEDAFSLLVERAFGFEVCVDRHERSYTNLRKGSPSDDHNVVPPTRETIDRYASLPWLDNDGDGVRAFIGILLETIAARPLMSFIDEPETFLHPRHARLIGQYLAEHTSQDGQLFVATHSEEVLQGILDSRTQRDVKVFRLDRTDGTHPVLEPERVRSLWAKPMFRYSRLLSGLFHRGVVICEADSDARFYEVHFDELFIDATDHDLSFTHLDGWKRFDQALGELRKLSIPSVVICDIDVLQNTAELTRLVEAAGGDFALIEPQVQAVQVHVAQMPAQPGMKNWQQMKQNAPDALGAGYARRATAEALNYLKSIGIFVVPVGELEAWYQLRCKKSQVVPQVLEKQLYKNPAKQLPDFLEDLARELRVPLPPKP